MNLLFKLKNIAKLTGAEIAYYS